MTVYLVGAGPGDPGLLTRRGEALLRRADVVVHDRLVDPVLLLLARPGAEIVDAGKSPGSSRGAGLTGSARAVRQEEINGLLVDRGRAGLTVVRLKGGDPFVFGRGGEEAAALAAAGVPWEVVPGVTSAFAVPAVGGVPVTHRGLATSVTVVTGHVGDPDAPGGVDWDALGRIEGTLVVLMGLANRREIAQDLLRAGRPGSTPVVVIEQGTTPSERMERTTLERLGDVGLGSPSVIVIGPVAGLRLSPGRGPLAGVTVVVTESRRAATGAPRPGVGLAGTLTAAGARVIELPAVAIADPEDGGAALADVTDRLADYRWVAFTSANAVDRLLSRLPDVRALAGVQLAAVGEATAGALAAYRLVADLVPERSSGQALAEAFRHPDRPGDRVLFPCAAAARPTLPDGLRAKGWAVDEVVAYRTVPAPAPGAETRRALEHADAVTFSSPSAVEAYLGWRDPDGRAIRVPPVVACLGPTVAAAARKRGLTVSVESPAPSADAVARALAESFAAAMPPVNRT